MNYRANQTGKISLLLLSSLLFRLLPVRVPNIEPITAALMPIAGVYGRIAGIFFAFGSVILYDALTATLGVHTFFTAGAFVALAIGAERYFRGKTGTVSEYMRFAAGATLFFDAVTGLVPGPIFFGQNFYAALAGQIPFTALHLLGNIVFAATLSPAIHHLLIRKRKKNDPAFIKSALIPKAI